jgi:hypothetical protein
MPKPETIYRSYLLRLWRRDTPDSEWRAMLESITKPGERQYFKNLESLVAYLMIRKNEEPYEEKGE